MRGTVVGIYGLRRLHRRRYDELAPKGLSLRLAVAYLPLWNGLFMDA